MKVRHKRSDCQVIAFIPQRAGDSRAQFGASTDIVILFNRVFERLYYRPEEG